MSIVSYGIGLSGLGSGLSGYYAVESVTMEVDVPDIILEYEEEEIVLVLDDEGTELVLSDDGIVLEVD
jgi:hypothetical protein